MKEIKKKFDQMSDPMSVKEGNTPTHVGKTLKIVS